MSEIRMLAAEEPLDDDALLALYTVADRSTPWLRANFISSIDGAATRGGQSGALGTPADRRVFALLRRLADVIVVGAGTVRAEGYAGPLLDEAAESWRLDHGLTAHPELAIISASLELDPDGELFTHAVRRPIVLAPAQASEARRAALERVADVVDCGEASVDLRMLRAVLAERGLTQQHGEGGPGVFAAMLEAGVVDELCLTVSPVVEAGDAGRIATGRHPVSAPMSLGHALIADDGTLLLRYTVA